MPDKWLDLWLGLLSGVGGNPWLCLLSGVLGLLLWDPPVVLAKWGRWEPQVVLASGVGGTPEVE